MKREGENYETSNLNGACNGGVCTLAMSSQATSPPLTLMPGEAAVMNMESINFGSCVRGVVFSNRPDVTVTAQIINTSTGEVTSHVIMANTEGDFH